MNASFYLETPRLLLRGWHDEDREPFAVMNADPEVMHFFAAPLTRAQSDEAVDRYQEHLIRDGFTMFAAEFRETHELAGVLGMQTMRDVVPGLSQPAVEIGWRLATRFQGQGLATEGARAVLGAAFDQPGLTAEIVAVTVPANVASRHVMEKLGMTHRPELSFDHPRVPAGHPYRSHVLYHLTTQDFRLHRSRGDSCSTPY